MIYVQQKLGISERRACKALGQSRGLQRRVRKRPEDEEVLIGEMTALAVRPERVLYGRWNATRTAKLKNARQSRSMRIVKSCNAPGTATGTRPRKKSRSSANGRKAHD
ncbi:MAG: hypothetical protein H6858_05050 [Rhodospirillales bacterium]|nr:hypothetical protein [Rhodospirillales bacterium]